MIAFFNWFVKITAWPVQKIVFRTKIYYEDKKVQGRKIKGPAIIISNHTAVYDYAVFLFVFWMRTLRYQMAELLFDKPVLGRFLKWMGGIYVNRNVFDFDFVSKSKEILDKGGVVGIFPEARIPRPEEKRPLPFKSSAAYIAYMSGVQLVPVVTNGVYFNKKKRAAVLIGKPFSVKEWWDPQKTQRANLQDISERMRKEIIRLTKELKKREERAALKPPFYYFLFDFVKVTSALPALIWFRAKTVFSSEKARKKYKKGVLFYSNHSSMMDPPYVMMGLWYRRIHFVTLQQILDNPKTKFWFTKVFRTIPVDRDNVNFSSFKNVTDFLEAGRAVCIFPEGHIKTNEEAVDSFKNGMILMAIKAKVPLVPIYVEKRKKWYQRQVMFQGEEINLLEKYGPMPSMSQIEEAGRLCRERELELARLAESYRTKKRIKEKN